MRNKERERKRRVVWDVAKKFTQLLLLLFFLFTMNDIFLNENWTTGHFWRTLTRHQNTGPLNGNNECFLATLLTSCLKPVSNNALCGSFAFHLPAHKILGQSAILLLSHFGRSMIGLFHYGYRIAGSILAMGVMIVLQGPFRPEMKWVALRLKSVYPLSLFFF